MNEFDLLDHQKEIARELVRGYTECADPTFFYAMNSGGCVVFFNTKPRRTIALKSLGDLTVLADQSLIDLRYSSDGKASGGSIRKALVKAVENDFQKPQLASAPTVYQTFYAPVGAVNSGAGRIETVVQNVGLDAGEVAKLMADMREAIESLPKDERAEAVEVANDLEHELRAEVPKQSKIKSYLLGLWNVGRSSADFVLKLTQIASAYGIDTKVFDQFPPQ